jgi:Cdc6-like AAA superfamily ATPase
MYMQWTYTVLSCHTKKSTTTTKLCVKGRNKRVLVGFNGFFYHVRVYALCINRQEKLAKDSLFYLFLKLLQINYIFSNNVGVVYVTSYEYTSYCRNPFSILLTGSTGSGKTSLHQEVHNNYQIVCKRQKQACSGRF